jgi:type VI protein secretion system component Hcp
MAQDKSTDVLMMMVLNGEPIPASCQTLFNLGSIAQADSLIKDFQPGCYFEVQDIDLELSAPAPNQQGGGGSGGGGGGGSSGASNAAGVQLNEVTITRQIDIASMVLMNCCIGTQGFDSATIIKRRAAGGLVEAGQAYLRIDFDGVLITKIDWTDQHIVQEKITFITRGLQVVYRPQMADGSLGQKTQQAQFTVPVKGG